MTWIDVYIGINIFIIGTLFGSFFSLANYRIPRKKDIVCTRSFCPKCNHKLSFFDLIPILSYLFQGGKCRYCKEKISIRYPLLEIGTGVLFLAIYMIFGITVYFFIAIFISVYLIMLTGCYVNKKKMLEEELDAINKDSVVNKKAGVFVTEVVIAAVILGISVGSIYASYKNSVSNNESSTIYNSAVFECTKNVELALSLKYDDLYSFTSASMAHGITYTTNVIVTKYSDAFNEKEDYIKTINAKTEYMYNGKMYSYETETIKKRY